MSSDSIMVKGKKSATRRPRKDMRRRAPRRRLDVRDQAGVTVTQNTFAVNANTMYTLRNFSLSNNVRASTVAQGYHYYRIKNVILKWIPYFDTFAAGTSAGLGVPQLYYMIDKTGSIPNNADLNTLKKMGAKAHRFDDRNVTTSFKPAVLLDSNDNAAGPAPITVAAGVAKTSPWLPTNMNAGALAPFVINSVDHRGITFYIQAQNFNANQCGALEITINYEYKKPLWVSPSTAGEVVVIDADELGKDSPPPEVSLVPLE